MTTPPLAAALAAALAVTACSKSRPDADTPADDAPAVESGMFAAIPADTPYVLASVDRLPDDVWATIGGMLEGLQPILETVVNEAEQSGAADSEDPVERFAFAAIQELDGHLSADGLEELGFSSRPRAALYAVGLMPVFRLELGDPEAFEATIRRIEKASGVELPRESGAGEDYWRLSDGGLDTVIAVLEGELVVAFGSAAAIDKGLPVVLGETPVADPLGADALRAYASERGMTGHMVGYLDVSRFVELALGAGEGVSGEVTAAMMPAPQLPEGCGPAVMAAVDHVSRVSFGYTSVAAEGMKATTLLETSPQLGDRLARVQTAVSGIGSGFAGSPMFAMGVAFDLDAGRSLVSWVADELGRVGDACGARELSAGAAELKESVGQPIPPPLATLRGAALVLQDAVMGESGPSGVEGYAVLGIDNPAALISIAKNFVPGLSELEVAGDGSFRPLPSGLTAGFPGKVALAAKSDALVVAAGESGQSRAEKALADKPSTSPLLIMSYDYRKFMELASSGGAGADPELLEMLEGVTSAIGKMTIAVSPSERGLVLDGEVELK